MLGYVALSLCGGLLKGVLLGKLLGLRDELPSKGTAHTVFHVIHSCVVGPLTEEGLFRALPLTLNPKLPFGVTAIPFGLAHVRMRPEIPFAWNAWRFGETAVGGLFYEAAYRKAGLLAAVGAHGAHNLGGMLGGALSRIGEPAPVPLPLVPLSQPRPQLADPVSYRPRRSRRA